MEQHTDWATLFFGFSLGVAVTVLWWVNSRLRAWWYDFERRRILIDKDGERLREYFAQSPTPVHNDSWRDVMRVEAPFSQEQVDHINEFQRTGFMHPFTCPHCSGCSDRDLIASENELRYPNCDYRQTWVHDFMANGEAVANYRRMWARFGFDTKPLSSNPTGEDVDG
jgi:hypothetical protein